MQLSISPFSAAAAVSRPSANASLTFSFAIRMLGGGLACLLHGIFPFLFVTTGSQTIQRLHDRMVLNRVRAGKVPQVAAPQ